MRSLIRIAAIILGAVACSPSQQNIDTQQLEAAKFYKHWDAYTRALFGCPLGGDFMPEQCHPKAGVLDYGEFLKARKEAMKVFKLEEASK